MEAHARRADDLDVAHPVLEHLAHLGPLEAELHVLRGERIAVVELQTFAQLEIVRLLIRAHRPRLGKARRHEIAGHRFHERVVHGVEHPERCQEPADDLAGIEPRRGEGDVQGPAHLAFGFGFRPRLSGGVGDEPGDDQDRDDEAFHDLRPPQRGGAGIHWMAWSARWSSDGGIVSPSAFAVFRLMTSSNLLGCSTGRSPGLAPFRILSTYEAACRHRSAAFGP